MKLNDKALREAIKQKAKNGQEIAEIVDASDLADEWIKESQRLWIRIEDVLALLDEREKELRRKMEECAKDMKYSSIRMGLIGEYSLIKEILGEEVSHNSK